MAKAAKASKESNMEEAQANTKELENKEINTEDVFIYKNEATFGNDDLRTLNEKSVHPSQDRPHLIEDDTPILGKKENQEEKDCWRPLK